MWSTKNNKYKTQPKYFCVPVQRDSMYYVAGGGGGPGTGTVPTDKPFNYIFKFKGGLFMYVIKHCRLSDSTLSEDARIEPRRTQDYCDFGIDRQSP